MQAPVAMHTFGFKSALCVLLLLVCGAHSASYPVPQSVGLGANADWFAGPNDYYNAAVYVDAFRQSRLFGHYGQPWVTTNFTYDSNGIPVGQSSFSVIVFDVKNPLNDFDGVWTVRITGANVTSDSSLNPGCCSQVYNQAYDDSTKQTLGYMNCSTANCKSGIGLDMSFVIESGQITNMELIRPGYPIDNYPMFTNAYIKMLQGFNTIRFMDWANTNGNVEMSEWSERNTLNTVQWGANGGGVPWEAVIELCNTLGSNAWVNIPLNASDDYMYQMALLFQQKLNPNLIIYLEFSNEPWNYAFPVGGITVKMAQELNATGNYNFLNFDHSNNIWYMGYRWYTWRAYIASNQFRKVYGDAAMMKYVRPVINSQYGGGQIVVGMPMIQAVFGPPQNFFWGAAIAPYFGGDNSSATPEELFEQVNKSSSDVLFQVANAEVAAKLFGLELVCYEGGPGVGGMIQYDTRLTQVIVDYMERLWSVGVVLFNYYSVGATVLLSDFWGTTDDMMNFTTPKYVALRNTLDADVSPFTYPFTAYPNYDIINASFTVIPQKQAMGWPSSWDLGRWSTWQYNFGEMNPNGAYYEMTFTYQASAPVEMTMYLNNEELTSFTLPNSSTSSNVTFYTIRTAPRVNVLFFNLTNFPIAGGSATFLYMEQNSTAPPAWEYPALAYQDGPTPSHNSAPALLPAGSVMLV